MTDFDADEIVRQRRRETRMPLIDKILGAIGLAMAACATFLPWYVYLHPEKFSMPSFWQGNDARSAGAPGPADPVGVAAGNDGHGRGDRRRGRSPDDGDGAGGSIRIPPKARTWGAPDQPFPGKESFKLMHVANGRALIEDASGMYIVRIGSVLPDNSRLATFEERDGRWVMITSKGEIFEAK
ncbi:flagellar protein [Sinorhizobium meliloti]|nr:flagellar protein [Sinorhizobium meliloti]